MTTADLKALARRAVACPRWRWMPGMVTTYGQRIARADADGYAVAYYRGGHLQMVEADALPNLTDPATLGCLLALVREAWCDAEIAIVRERDLAWIVCHSLCNAMLYDGRYIRGSTEAEAHIVALERSP